MHNPLISGDGHGDGDGHGHGDGYGHGHGDGDGYDYGHGYGNDGSDDGYNLNIGLITSAYDGDIREHVMLVVLQPLIGRS